MFQSNQIKISSSCDVYRLMKIFCLWKSYQFLNTFCSQNKVQTWSLFESWKRLKQAKLLENSKKSPIGTNHYKRYSKDVFTIFLINLKSLSVNSVKPGLIGKKLFFWKIYFKTMYVVYVWR